MIQCHAPRLNMNIMKSALFHHVKKSLILCGLVFGQIIFAHAQNQNFQDYNWYFGNSDLGLIFSKGNNQPDTINNQNNAFGYGIGGPAVVSGQQSGEILFYTDGNNVFDNSHQRMPNGNALNANTQANQATAVVPVPDEDDRYYILTNTANGTNPGSISYSIVDMTQAGNGGGSIPARGDVIVKNQPTGIGNSTEAMVAFSTGGPTNYRYWLIVQESGTNDIRLFEIQTGNNFVLANTLTLTANIVSANFSIHRPTQRIAIAPLNAGTNIQVINFTPGGLTFETAVTNTGNLDSGPYSIYDTEWSLDGSKIYFSRTGDGVQNGQLLRKDLNNPSASVETIPTNTLFRSYGLQRGPDRRMYHLYQETSGGPFLLGRVDSTNNVLDSVFYNAAPFGTMDFNGRQFPAFAPDKEIEVDNANFDFYGTCSENPTHFFPEIEPQPDNIFWDFGDGNQSGNPVPVHQYDGPGSYPVSMIYSLNGEVDTVIKTVNIQMAESVDLGADTVICPGESLTLDAGPGGVTYRWSVPGETGQTIEVNSAGLYWVVKDNGTCTSYDAISVEIYGEQEQYFNFWYFGNMAGLDFNDGVSAVTDGQLQSPAGSATFSDPNGDLILYTDGVSVFDRDHNLVGNNIGGNNNATQSSLIVPVPDDSTLFYIFTTEDIWDTDHTYRLKYSLYDIKELATNPLVEQNKTLYYRTTERLAALNVLQGNNWLLSHEFGTNTFRSYPITGDGIADPVLSSVGSVHGVGPAEAGEGYMQIAPTADKVAVALVNQQNQNVVEIFDFDQNTGELSNPVSVTFQEAFPAYQAYGVEFSGSGNKLFVTLSGASSKIYELPLFYMNQDSVTQNMVEIADESLTFGALQMGPDNQIYVAVDGENFVARFSPDEDTASVTPFNIGNQVDLAGRSSGLGLPDHVQVNGTSMGGPAMAVTDGCLGTPSSFTSTTTSMLDEVFWDYGEGTSTNDTLTHTFQNPGPVTIELTITNRCGLDTTLLQDIMINEPPDDPTINPVEILCTPPLLLDANANNDPSIQSYQWSTGHTTRAVSFNQGFANASVTMTDNNGCQSSTDFEVFDASPQTNLPDDFTICQNEPVSPLDAGDWDAFTWTINGANAGNTRFQNVDTSTPGTYQYMVEIDDNFTGCSNVDSVTITINEVPSATYNVTNSDCNMMNGAIDITTLSPNTSITWLDNTGTPIGSGMSVTSLASGTYTLELTHDLSGCPRTYSIPVLDNAPSFTINTTETINCNDNSEIVVTLGGVTTPSTVTYDLIDQATTQSVSAGSPGSDNFTISNIGPGTYDLIVTADGCTDQSTGININPPATADLQVDPSFDVCADNATIMANSSTPGANFTWEDPSNNVISTSASADVSGLNNGAYTVTVTAAGACDTTATVQVTINDIPATTINVVDPGCDGSATLRADPQGGSGNYTYSWNTGAVSQSIVVNTTGDYSLTVRDATSGCQSTAGPQNVVISPPIEIDFTWDPIPCQDGELLTVTANTNVTPDSYTWYQNDVLLQNDSTETVETFGDGVFRVEVTRDGCSAENTVSLFRLPLTPVDVEPLFEICPAPPVSERVEIEVDVSRFQNVLVVDSTDNSVVFDGLEEVIDEIDSEGIYRLTYTNNSGCETVAITRVEEVCVPTLYAPNAFSPQASIQENTTFNLYPMFIQEESFEIFIYNRWGELIYYSDDLDFMTNSGWDGTINGEMQPSGTYAYLIRYKSLTEPERGFLEKTGGVNLLK